MNGVEVTMLLFSFRSVHASSSSTHRPRSPDHHRVVTASHGRRRSRSRSPHYRHHPPPASSLRPSNRDTDVHFGGYRASDVGLGSDVAAVRAGVPGHAFTSLLPSAAVGSVSGVTPASAGSFGYDTRKLIHERDRLSSLTDRSSAAAAAAGGVAAAAAFMPSTSLPSQLLHGADADAMLRDRLFSEQRDRMMFAAAAAAAELSARPPRGGAAAADSVLRPDPFASHSGDNLLGSVHGSALAAQSALLRPPPALGCPPPMTTIKLPQPYGPMIDPALASLNLPFR